MITNFAGMNGTVERTVGSVRIGQFVIRFASRNKNSDWLLGGGATRKNKESSVAEKIWSDGEGETPGKLIVYAGYAGLFLTSPWKIRARTGVARFCGAGPLLRSRISVSTLEI